MAWVGGSRNTHTFNPVSSHSAGVSGVRRQRTHHTRAQTRHLCVSIRLFLGRHDTTPSYLPLFAPTLFVIKGGNNPDLESMMQHSSGRGTVEGRAQWPCALSYLTLMRGVSHRRPPLATVHTGFERDDDDTKPSLCTGRCASSALHVTETPHDAEHQTAGGGRWRRGQVVSSHLVHHKLVPGRVSQHSPFAQKPLAAPIQRLHNTFEHAHASSYSHPTPTPTPTTHTYTHHTHTHTLSYTFTGMYQRCLTTTRPT